MRQANFTLKSVWQFSLGLMLMLAVPIWGTAQTFVGAGNPQAINDNSTTTSAATAVGAGIIGVDVQIDMVELDITHTFDADLEITLVSPMGTTLDLSSDNGGADDNYTQTVFMDGAPNVTTGAAPFTGTFAPEAGTFAATFDGEAIAGDWVLQVFDDAGGDTGTLNEYSITFGALVAPPPPPTITDTYCGVGNPQPLPTTGTGGFPCVGGPTTSAATATAAGTIGVDATIVSVEIDLTHTFDSDLEITLISPNGITLDLSSDNGGAGDNYTNTVFMDGAPAITGGAAPFTGTFAPEGGTFAATFDGEQTDGDWTLSICDDAGGDSGTLLSYCINFEIAAPPPTEEQACGVGNPQPIPTVGTGGFPCVGGPTTSAATVVTDGVIGTTATLASVEIDLTHTFDSDLEMTLISPNGTMLDLSSDNGGAGDDYTNTVFMDGAPNITTGAAPFTGTFEAEGGTFAATFDGESTAGDWVLSICDDAGGDSGTLLSYCINFEFLPPPPCEAPLAVCQPVTFILNDSDPIVVAPEDIDGGSTADCGLASLTVTGGEFTCFDAGDQIVTLTIEDVNGDMSSCEATVTIVNTFMASEIGCIGDLNVTLGENCSQRITPSMVLTGNNIECAGNAVVTVDGTDSDIISGCGEHTYVVEVGTPEVLTTGFAAADWTFVEELGFNCAGEFATATLTPDEIDLSILWGDLISASYTAPVDGEVSFQYDFNDADTGFDMFIIDVNGNMVVDVNFAVNGVVNEQIMAGQTIVIELDDDDFCGIPGPDNPARVVLNNFSFVSEAMDFNTCWGTIFAEDKTDPIVECPDNTDEATVDFDLQILEGSIDGTEATIALDDYSCFQSFFEPAAGVDYNYDLITFTVSPDLPATDVYNIQTASNIPGLNIALFQGAFNEDNPCENILGGSEGAYFVDPFFGINAFFDQDFRIEMPLEPGQTYTLMVANTSFGTTGDYVIGIVSDNGGEFIGGGFSAPQPVTVDVPLYCEDLDLVRFTFPQSWIASANGALDFTATRNTFFGGSSADLNAFLDKLSLLGLPVVGDNCGPVLVTVSDAVVQNGDCGTIVITRTFTVADRYDGACIGAPRTVSCEQIITLNRPTVLDLVLPPYTATIECDENFPTDGSVGGPDDNPAASTTGYPFLLTASGYQDLSQAYCNLGASYSDEPRIDVCEGTYKFRREWNIIDWCSPSDNVIWDQYVKVGDYTGPDLSGIPADIDISTSPFGCLGNFPIPTPVVTDGNGCSSAFATRYTLLANGVSFFAGGEIADGDVLQLPIGEHRLILCAEDDCGNETCESYTINVADRIEPTASCNDELNVSIGGGDVANGVEGIARIFAADVDEGSNDNCGEVTVEVRRNYWRDDTCNPSANRWSPWGPYVDFYCCDIDNEITLELRVTDEAGNENICWQVITPEDKLNPYCYAPAPVSLTCSDLPLAFPGDIETAYDEDFEATSIMMSSIFGGATGTDNCAVDTIVERTPNIQVNDCGWGSITRRFEAWQLRPEGDANGNGAIDINEVFRSTNSCSQLITITETHDFVIDFPEDADADCGDPDVPTIITEALGCDVLTVNIGEPVIFSATGDECYKYSITYDVINWCLWDGEYTGYVLPRMTEDDGEALPVDRAVEGNERPVVRYSDASFCIDRRHNDRDGDSSLDNCFSPDLPNYGRYIYTQFVKVYDSTAPVVSVGEYGGPTANCPDLLAGQFGDDDGNCEEAVSIPFSVSDECELFDGDGVLVVSIVSAELDAFAVDANGDGDIKSNEFVADEDVASLITDNGDGTYSFDGTFPIITSAMGDNIYHAVRVLFEDGCGNQTSETIVFDVIDCKGPAPVCINGLTVTLMPQDDGGCAMAIWASDFEGSPISDCTGQGPELFGGLPRVTKYAIYRAADVEADPNFVPSPDDTGLVLTQDDDQSTVVYVYAFDEEGNYDYCETYVLVQQHVDCGTGTGTLSGVIMTENSETVEGVEVNVNGGAVMSMTTNTDGTYSFDLDLGGDYTVTPYLNANPLNGVSTFDLVLMSKHILGVQTLDSPYKRIAADINRSSSITTLDMIQLRKLILNIDTQFGNNTSWRFVDAAYSFPVATNPWFEAFPELINENNFSADILDANFVGVKIGDVNGNAQANALAGDDRTLNGQFNFEVENVSVKAGNVYTVAFTGAEMASVTGFQGTLNLNGAELVDIEYGAATAENFGLRYAAEGQITTSWNGKATSEDVLFSLVIRPTADADLSDIINVSSRYTAAEAYGNGNTMNVGVNFSNGEVAAAGFEMFQNTPNPFAVETLIGFNLPQDAEVTLTINDASGRVLTVLRGDYAAGYNTINVSKSQVQGATGVLGYTVTAGEFTATKTMIAVK